MKTFKVIYEEVLQHEFYIDAESLYEVPAAFQKAAEENALDFSGGDLISGQLIKAKDLDGEPIELPAPIGKRGKTYKCVQYAYSYADLESIVQSYETEKEREPARWEDILVGGELPAVACSKCHTFFPISSAGGGYTYCPQCGAKMEFPPMPTFEEVIEAASPEERREMLPKGTTIELISMEDKYAVPVGTKGEVDYIDDAGTIHMKWETGSSLGLIPGPDKFKVIDVNYDNA